MPNPVYSPAVTWHCEECHQAGDLSIPPANFRAATPYELADQSHALADPECAKQWGARFVYVSQSEYPD